MANTRVIKSLSLAFVAVLLCICGSVFAATKARVIKNDSSIKVAWSYKGSTGPEFWGQLSPRFSACSQGKAQSPIDIGSHVPFLSSGLSVDYHPAPMFIVNNGVIEVNIGLERMVLNMGKSVQVDFRDNSNASIKYLGETYKLVQFHFHSPSENQIKSKSSPLEIHFVHQGSHGALVVLAVLVEGGDSNPEIEKIIEHIPSKAGDEKEVKGERINPNDLLPMIRHYYSFDGSLTTPPCTEGVQWVVMADTITASPAQMMALRKAMGGANSRPVQPLNGRVISYSAEKKS